MFAIMRREFSSYFQSPIGFVFLAVFYGYAASSFLFILYMQSSNLMPVFSSLFTVILFLIPILTMRLFSEERKNKTDQALLTAPVSLTGLVAGKFLAASIVYAIGLAITLVYAVILSAFGAVSWSIVIGNFVGMLLMGMALVAIGMFISALTENQIIAVVAAFVVNLALLMIDQFASMTTNPVLLFLINGLSFYTRFADFTSGIFDLSGILFFISVCVVFIFLTVRTFEKRRWS